MTTIQLAHSLARHLTQPDLAQLDAAAKLDVMQAMNSALQVIYAAMPPAHKTTTISETLRGPVTVAFAVPARYANTLTAPVFAANQRGCTVFMGSDESANEIVAADAVLDQYTATPLSGNATIYHDAVHLYSTIERVVSQPSIFRNGEQVRYLERWQTDFDRLPKTIGTPLRYCVIPCGASQGADPRFYLRVWPLPDTDYKLRFDAELSAARVTFAQITTDPVALPLSDSIAESILLPLALGKLLGSPDWADKSSPTTSRIERNATEAVAMLRLTPWDVAPAFNAVGTPAGF